jgi:hypothetical protein
MAQAISESAPFHVYGLPCARWQFGPRIAQVHTHSAVTMMTPTAFLDQTPSVLGRVIKCVQAWLSTRPGKDRFEAGGGWTADRGAPASGQGSVTEMTTEGAQRAVPFNHVLGAANSPSSGPRAAKRGERGSGVAQEERNGDRTIVAKAPPGAQKLGRRNQVTMPHGRSPLFGK